MNNSFNVTSISWIESSALPHAETKLVIGSLGSWANRVAIGIVATSNPTPSQEISVPAFRAKKQYRSLTHYEIFPQFPNTPKNVIFDAGYTPPFEKSKIQSWLSYVMPIPDEAMRFHKGELSKVTDCTIGRLHPASTLDIPVDAEVLVSTLIKFRAGEATNNIGISSMVRSPVHVPWVWCEHALVKQGKEYFLVCCGSKFPSHAWYINGTKVASFIQDKIVVSEREPAISTGRPSNQPRSLAENDTSTGSIVDHDYSLQKTKALSVNITQYLL